MKVYTIIKRHYQGEEVSHIIDVVATYTDYFKACQCLVEFGEGYQHHCEVNFILVETNPFLHSGRVYQIIENELF